MSHAHKFALVLAGLLAGSLATVNAAQAQAPGAAAGASSPGASMPAAPMSGASMPAAPMPAAQSSVPASPSASIPRSTTPAATAPPEAAAATINPGKRHRPKPESTVTQGTPLRADAQHDQRKAAKMYLKGVALLEKQQPEAAWHYLKQAAELEPSNATYVKASDLAQQSAVTQLVQQSTMEREKGDAGDATTLLRRALELDDKNSMVMDHIGQLADKEANTSVGISADATLPLETKIQGAEIPSGPIFLQPNTGKRSFHIRSDTRQAITQIFREYGILVSIHDSVQSRPTKLDLDDVTFQEAMRVLGMLTHTFYEPLDPHRVIVALDNRENRAQFQRLQIETIYLPGLSEKELMDVSKLAHDVFDAQQSAAAPTAGTLTLRASNRTLDAFNHTMHEMIDGRPQVQIDVKIIQLAHVSDRETGTTFFQQTGVYNVFSEINSVLSQNQSLVQQVIASGLVANSNTLANQIEILAILVASGQLTGTPFNQGFLPFGGGLTQSIVTPGPATLNMSLNSSDTRTLEDLQLRVGDDEPGTFKTGVRYPIETSSFSAAAVPAALAALAGGAVATAAAQTVPQIQYEDLGLTFKATPKVLRSNDVAITLDLKISSLGGTALNDIPILNNQQFTGVVTLKVGETAVLLSDLSRQESRALSGLPGIGDIPGLEDVSDIKRDRNVARLLVLVTPSVVLEPAKLTHGPMLMVDKAPTGHNNQ